MDNIMKSFQITLTNNDEISLTHHTSVEKINFAEAAVEAYKTRNKLGFDWRITNVRENIRRTNTQNSETLGTVSLP